MKTALDRIYDALVDIEKHAEDGGGFRPAEKGTLVPIKADAEKLSAFVTACADVAALPVAADGWVQVHPSLHARLKKALEEIK